MGLHEAHKDSLAEKELFVDSVEFCYSGQRSLLTGGYLVLKVGQVLGFLGRNGTGKSTFMKIVFGSLKAQFAYIRVNGVKVNCAFATKEVCLLPQDSFLPTAKKVKTMINFMLKDEAIREEIYNDEIIKPILNNKVAELSAGELRYLEILLLLNQKATFILLDEPFTGISPVLKEKIQEHIRRLKDRKGIMVSDHDYMNVLEVSDQLLLLENGACRKIEKKEDLELFYLPEGTFDRPSDKSPA